MTQSTIKISSQMKSFLDARKVVDSESYEDVLWDLIEDTLELSDKTKKDLEEARKEVEKGNVISYEEVMKEYGFTV